MRQREPGLCRYRGECGARYKNFFLSPDPRGCLYCEDCSLPECALVETTILAEQMLALTKPTYSILTERPVLVVFYICRGLRASLCFSTTWPAMPPR
jgi:hypothetical protein